MTKYGMLREHSNLLNYILRLTDIVVLVLASYLSFIIYLGQVSISFYDYRDPVIISVAVCMVIFPIAGLYKARRGVFLFYEAKDITFAVLAVFVFLLIVSVATKTSALYSRAWFGIWFLLAWGGIVFSHFFARILLRWMRSLGLNQRSVVIVSAGEVGTTVVNQITNSPWAGFQIKGMFGDFLVPDDLKQTLPQTGSYDDLKMFIDINHVDQIWIAMPISEESLIEEILHDLRHATADIRYIPDIFGFRLLNHSITDVAGLPVLNLSVTPVDGINRWMKLLQDFVLSSAILLLISPLMLCIAIGVKLSSKGPIFYKQRRLGWNGREFNILKFRSMPVDAEKQSGAVWAQKGELRATSFGSFLRRTSLDELPQFLNVLKGEMSIVGPRPERPELVEQFKDEIPGYMKKHLVKAGITGWAQVNGWRGNTCLEKRIQHDLFYIENWSFWFDLKIIFLTIFKGFIHKNAY